MPQLSANAKRQVELTARAERTFHAAAFKHYKVISDNGTEVKAIDNLEPGTSLLVEWHDPRPDSDVWKPVGASSGTSSFVYHDGPTLALEMHAIAMGLCDAEKKMYRGLWLYAALEGTPSFFWSMIINYHATGKCFPPLPKKYQNEQDNLAAKAVFSKEIKAQMKKMEDMKRGVMPMGAIGSTYSCITQTLNDLQMKAMGVPNATRVIPEPVFVGDKSPAWMRCQENHWTSGLKAYIAGTAKAPCLWVLKVGQGLVGCQAKGQCPADHDGPKKTGAQVDRMINKPIGQQEAEMDYEVAAIDNGVACSNPVCEAHKRLVEETELKRCSRCHNTTYCGAPCQKAHWKEHKPDCRARSMDLRPDGNVWAMVLPGEGRRPYPLLLPADSYLQKVQEILGGKVMQRPAARGDDLDGVSLVYRIDEASVEAGAPVPVQSLPVNQRGSAILTPLTMSRGQVNNMVVVSGREARCRGTAIAIRTSEPDTVGAPLMDFGNDDYNDRWGIFSALGLGAGLKDDRGNDVMMCTLMKRTPENEKMLGEMMAKALNGRR